MKKRVLGLSLTAMLVLAGCDDKQQSQVTEQLRVEVAEAGAKLVQAEQNSANLTNEINALKAELAKAQNQVPALQVEIVPLVNKYEKVKNPKPKTAEDEWYREESVVQTFISVAKTGVAWLDNALLAFYVSEEDRRSKITDYPALQQYFEQAHQDTVAEVQENVNDYIGASQQTRIQYLGQRNNLATFSAWSYTYTGGAHGMYTTDYGVFDLNKKARVTFDDLFSAENQAKLKALLWAHYEQRSCETRQADQEECGETFTSKEDFEVTSNFYFSEDGVNFVYPPYALGPFAEGEITLPLYWFEVNPLLNKAYQIGEKDGYFPDIPLE